MVVRDLSLGALLSAVKLFCSLDRKKNCLNSELTALSVLERGGRCMDCLSVRTQFERLHHGHFVFAFNAAAVLFAAASLLI